MRQVASETERITRLVEDLLLLARVWTRGGRWNADRWTWRGAVDAVGDAHVADQICSGLDLPQAGGHPG